MRLGKFSAVVAAALVVASIAPAQQPGFPGGGGFGGFGGGGLGMMVGSNKQLQDELKVSKDQVDKLTEATTKVREDLRDEMAKLFDRETTQADREKIMKKMADANTKAVDSVLKPEQVKRLHQIENQQAGLGLFTKEESAAPLKLTDKQKEQVDDISKELQKDLRDVRGFGADTQKKRQELTKGAMDSVRKTLTDKQKDTLKEMLGEPFELTFAGPGGGFGPGGGGRGGFGGFGQPGQILASGVQDQLKLTDDQKKKLTELQKDTDSKLEKILTEEQRKQLKQMQQPGGRGPGGPPQ